MEAPEYFQSNYYSNNRTGTPQFTPETRISDAKNDQFVVEEFFDFSNEDDHNNTNNNVVVGSGGGGDATTTFDTTTLNGGGTSTESSTVTTVVDSCNSSFSGCEPHVLGDVDYRNFAATDGNNFSNDLCVPYDDLAELEWLSNFVEESFSSEDLQKLQLISGMNARPDETSSQTREFQPDSNKSTTMFRPEMPVPGKARSKRSRAAPCNWTSRLLVLSPSTSSSESDVVPVNNTTIGKKTVKTVPKKKEVVMDHGSESGDGRRCLHCATDKTPQWRTGPMGPKTLCNACGVRYKSGRLVPEYRPAASPTFVLTKHSNSHRKVLELRRQKDMIRSHQHQHQHQHQQFLHHQNMMFDVSNGDDYLIHQHVGPDFQQLI